MIALIFGVLTSIAHYFSETLCMKCKSFRGKLLSFSGGIAISYIFIDLFPKFSYGASEILFVSVLVGFVLLHIVEKYIYQTASKNELMADLAIEDSIASFIYHFIVGILMASFFAFGFKEGVFFFIPTLLYTSISTLPVDPPKHKVMKVVLSLSTLAGVIFGVYVSIPSVVYFSLLGFLIGVLSFTVTRHGLPMGKQGNPLLFFLGAFLYTTLLLVL